MASATRVRLPANRRESGLPRTADSCVSVIEITITSGDPAERSGVFSFAIQQQYRAAARLRIIAGLAAADTA